MKFNNAITNGMVRMHIKGSSLVKKAARNLLDRKGNASTGNMMWILIAVVAGGIIFALIKAFIPDFWSKIKGLYDAIV